MAEETKKCKCSCDGKCCCEDGKCCCKKEDAPKGLKEEDPVVVKQEIKVGGKPLKYSVTTGRMPIKTETGEIDAQMFYHAYIKDGRRNNAKRPVMFSFNGGPGSPSLWLHLGALGPKRVNLPDDASAPKPPFKLIDNQHTWLTDTDLVFVDPIGTGYSRGKTEKDSEKYWGLKGDIESVAEFIRMWLIRNERLDSPIYIVGESYGTTRGAGLAGYLVDHGIALNGLVLVSSILNFQTARFVKGNDLPYELFLPTYTATAYYHGKLDKELSKDLQKTLKAVREFAGGEYASALKKGDLISKTERKAITKKLARFTGLSEEYCDYRDMRIQIWMFCKELCRKEKRTVGRLDSRYRGMDDTINGANEGPDHDPSMSLPSPPFNHMYQHYCRTELGYKTDLQYHIFKGVKKPWNWGSAGDGPPDTSEALRNALVKNPAMKVFIASGYYDLATPFYATEFTVAHMGLDPEVQGNFETCEYESGHMMYIHDPSLKKLKTDLAKFIKKSL